MSGGAGPRKLPGATRTRTARETIRRARPLAARLGVTRVADITGLDRVGIPTVSAIVPDSGDFLSVYNGKGLTRGDALAGALMEAIERQAVVRARPPLTTGTLARMKRCGAVLDPRSLTAGLHAAYDPRAVYDWVRGVDLMSGEAVWLPAAVAGYCWSHLPHPSPMAATTTHGLAAGNCFEEAVSQSLCEWIERDAWTLAHLAAHWRPRARIEARERRDPGLDFDDDGDLFPCLDLRGLGGAPATLLRRFERAGLRPLVRDITSDLGVPVIVAAVAEDDVPGFPQAHMGVGAHPEAGIAIARALAEAAQSRAADIQGIREDLALADDESATGVALHTRRVRSVDRRRWLHRPPTRTRNWRDLPDRRFEHPRREVEFLLGRLRAAGIRRAVVVDFSPRSEAFAVVRVVVPGLETWIAEQGRIGDRAAAHWRTLNRAEKES